MPSITDLQNTLNELQSMINGTLQPVFNDLQNTSHVFDPVISSHTLMIQKIEEMTTFLNSGVIVGLKGDNGLSFNDTMIIKSNDSNVLTSSSVLSSLLPLSTPLEPNSIYEINAYIGFSTASTTTGLYLQLNTPVGSVAFTDISIPITNVQSSGTLRFLSPNGITIGTPAVKSTGVNTANSALLATIKGHIFTGSNLGNLEVMIASEVNGSSITVNTNTKLFLRKVQ